MRSRYKYKTILILLVAVGCLIADIASLASSVASSNSTASKKLSLVLFYSIECPHCREIINFMRDKKLDTRATIEQKEISTDAGNRNEFLRIVKGCDVKLSAVPLPVLWTGQKCLIGDEEVMKYFAEEFHVQ